MNQEISQTEHASQRFSGKQVALFVGLAVLATALVTTWWVNQYLYAATFEPIQLSQMEQHSLDRKMAQLGQSHPSGSLLVISKVPSSDGTLTPEPYSEDGASRKIQLTEREVNSLIANDAEIDRKSVV